MEFKTAIYQGICFYIIRYSPTNWETFSIIIILKPVIIQLINPINNIRKTKTSNFCTYFIPLLTHPLRIKKVSWTRNFIAINYPPAFATLSLNTCPSCIHHPDTLRKHTSYSERIFQD